MSERVLGQVLVQPGVNRIDKIGKNGGHRWEIVHGDLVQRIQR